MADGTGLKGKGSEPPLEVGGGLAFEASDSSAVGDRVSFTLIAPGAPPASVREVERPPRRATPTLLLLVAAGLVGLFVDGAVRGASLVGLVLLASWFVWGSEWISRRRRAARATPPGVPTEAPDHERRALVLTPESLSLEHRSSERISLPGVLSLCDGFGVVLVSNRRRDRLVAAVTSDAGTMLFATSLGSEDRRELAGLLARSTVVGGDEQALDATGFDGSPVHLPPRAFRSLMGELTERDATCLDRIVLSDQHGHALTLDQHALTAQGKRFDLTRPLEWRSILFQEPFGHAVTLYQGTWIRQGATEVVLISLLTPSFFEASATDVEGAGVPELDVMARRDQRLLQATAADPPPTEQRVAMDGLFIVPLRAALDQAPRASSQTVRSGHPQ